MKVGLANLRTIGWVAAICLVPSASGTSASGSLQFSFDGSAKYEAAEQVSGLASGLIFSEATNETAYSLEGIGSRYYVVNVPRVITSYRLPGAGNRTYAYNEDPSVLASSPIGGPVTLHSSRPGISLRLLPLASNGVVRFEALNASTLVVAPAGSSTAWGNPDALRGAGEVVNHGILPERGNGEVVLPPHTATTAAGDFFALHWNGTFLVDGIGLIETGSRLNTSKSVRDPSGSVERLVYDQLCLIVTSTSAHVMLNPAGGRLVAHPDTLAIVAASAASFVGVRGQFQDIETHTIAGGLLQLRGQFQSKSTFAQDGRSVASNGTFQEVQVDGVSLLQNAAPSDLEPFPMVASTIGFLAAIAWLVSGPGQKGLAWILWNSTTPLGNPIRQRMLAMVQSSPGLTHRDLSLMLGHKDRRFARYHIEVLRRAHLIDAVPFGNKTVLMPNGGSLAGTVTGPLGSSIELRNAVAALSHPRRREIFRILRAHGPAVFPTIRRLWDKSEPSCPKQPAFRFHAKKMVAAGLIRSERVESSVLWSVNHDVARRLEMLDSRGTNRDSVPVRPLGRP